MEQEDKRFCQEEHFADIWSAEGLGKPAPRPGFTNPNLSRGLVQSRMSQILTIIMGVICVCRWDLLGAGGIHSGNCAEIVSCDQNVYRTRCLVQNMLVSDPRANQNPNIRPEPVEVVDCKFVNLGICNT